MKGKIKKQIWNLILTDESLSLEGKTIQKEDLETKHFNVDHWALRNVQMIMYVSDDNTHIKILKCPYGGKPTNYKSI